MGDITAQQDPGDWRKSSYSMANGDCVEVWRKSSYSGYNGDCVEMAWRKSSHSTANGDCVEIAAPGEVLVRDSKNPAGGMLSFTPAEWAAFLAEVRGGGLVTAG
jgi:hypothetical protein